MNGFLRKIKLKHAGFVIGVLLLISGWFMRLLAALVLKGSMGAILDRFGYYASGASVFFILGGIVFFAAVSSKEQEDSPSEPLTEAEAEQKHRDELESASYEVKNSIPFTAVYGFFSILLVLGSASIILNHDQSVRYGISGLIAGLILSRYYIRKSIRQFQWLKQYKDYSKNR